MSPKQIRLALFGLTWVTLCIFAHPGAYQSVPLTLAIVKDHTVRIDPYAGLLQDKAYRDGHYYVGRHPGYGLLCVPSGAVAHLVYDHLFPTSLKNRLDTHLAARYAEAELSELRTASATARFGEILWMSSVTIVTVSAVCGGLIAVVFYNLLTAFGLRETDKIVMSLTVVLGTFVGFYAASNTHTPYVLFALLGFYLLYQRKAHAIVCGLTVGLTMMMEYQALLIAALLSLYALTVLKPRQWMAYALGVVVAVLPLLAFNWLSYGSPFKIHTDFPQAPDSWGTVAYLRPGFHGVTYPHWSWMMEYLFSPKYGYLLLMPVAVVGVLYGVFAVMTRHKIRAEALLAMGVFIVYWLGASCGAPFFQGVAMGARYMIPSVPFVVFLAALGLCETKNVRRIVLVATGCSLLLWLVILQYPVPYETFKTSTNPLLDYYWPMVSQHVVHSMFLDHVGGMLHWSAPVIMTLNIAIAALLLGFAGALLQSARKLT